MKTTAVIVGVISVFSYISLGHYLIYLKVVYAAFHELLSLPQEHIDEFFEAYKHLETMPVGMPREADYKAVHDYYRVLHVLLTAGYVMEIMAGPPVIDREQGIRANHDLWIRRMADRMLVKPGDRLLDTGCGRGMIAMKIATWTNTSVVGVNIDETQITYARRRAFDAGMEKRLEFHHQDYNLPFHFLPDESMDGHYCAQACMFTNNKTAFMKESARVLKKGARFYGLEYIQLPNYDETNPSHVELVQKSSTILGTSMPGPISGWTDAMKAAGFRVLYVDHPTPKNSVELLHDINAIYAPMQYVISGLGKVGLMSQRLVDLFERLRRDWDALVVMMDMELATFTYEFVAEKL